MDDRLGGHFVTGHVDAVGTVTLRKDMGDVLEMEISIPETLMLMVVEKGSIAVDGVSLTINAVRKNSFAVAVIPHTVARTTLGQAKPGRRVNIETDLLGKYVYRYLACLGTAQPGITKEFLARYGFE
jgi:riboflavin synthase